MPPLPVINKVFRVSLVWSPSQGINPVNVMHVRTDQTDVTQLASDLASKFTAAMFQGMSNFFSLSSINVLPLDGHTVSVDASVASVAGAATGDICPAIAYVMSFKTANRGPRARGRMFIGPCGESSNNSGLIVGTTGTNMLNAWNTFHTAIGAVTPSIKHVIASYTHQDANDVVAKRIDQYLGTVRRRQDQMRP